MAEHLPLLILSQSATGELLFRYLSDIHFLPEIVSCQRFKEMIDGEYNYGQFTLLADAGCSECRECFKAKGNIEKINRNFLSSAFFNVKRDDELEIKAVRKGIRGIFYTDEPFELLKKELNYLASGGIRLSKQLLYKASQGLEEISFIQDSEENENLQISSNLTKRENEIIDILLTGATNKEIACQLFISEATVKRHLSNIYRKLDVNSRVGALRCIQGMKVRL